MKKQKMLKTLDTVFSDWHKYEQYNEKMYFTFSNIPNKKKFVKYVRSEYLPSIYAQLNEYEDLEGAYYSYICDLINRKIDFLETWLSEKEVLFGFNTEIEPTPDVLENKKSATENGWFDVGLKFADGTIKKEKNRPSFEKITIDAGLNKSLRPYVSDTYNGNNKNGKNIFNHSGKMLKIYDYCTEHEISLSDWFLEEYEKLKPTE